MFTARHAVEVVPACRPQPLLLIERTFGDRRGGNVRVLGVDPGLTRCGLAAVDGRPGRGAALVAVGVVRTAADSAVGERLIVLEREVEAWLERWRPDAVAVERVFSQRNVR